MTVALTLAETGVLPDSLLRWGIRRLLADRLRDERSGGPSFVTARQLERERKLATSPLALHTDKANEQHYALPPEFFRLVLGPHLKYSAALWPTGTSDLAAAERAMLHCYEQRAGLWDGQRVLDLGCGWGSFTLWSAARFPRSTFLAVSNSPAQIAHVRASAAERGLDNVTALAADVNDFTPEGRFDRIVSVEMLEHVRNHRTLFERIARWLAPDGRLFVHIFCHHELSYPFEIDGDADWMARYFFTGGLMPSADTLVRCQDQLALEQRWLIDGQHYRRTARAWLERFDAHASEIEPVLAQVYGRRGVARWMQRWRLFFMACEELFGYRDGQEWLVAHYRFRHRSTTPA
jgi:cyclopropane-fatty-acyl-phospholipid synthase